VARIETDFLNDLMSIRRDKKMPSKPDGIKGSIK
jgi:hypothetical protein